MIRAVRTEFVKYFSTRMWWGMAIAVAGVGLGMTFLIGLLMTNATELTKQMSHLSVARVVYLSGAGTGYLLLLIIGVMFVGQEYRHKTITSTFLSFPRRGKLMWAKVIAMLGVGAFYGIVYLVPSIVAGAVMLSAGGFTAFPQPGELFKTFLVLLLVLGLWGLLGLGLGILIPNQVAAIVIAVAVVWIVEPILQIVLLLAKSDVTEAIFKVLPSNASNAALEQSSMMGVPGMGLPQLSWWGALIALALWGGISAFTGSLLTVRKDIS